MGDIIVISELAVKVYTAYKDAPDNYRHISDEVKSLHIRINKAIKLFKSSTLSDSDRQEGQEVLKGCQNVLEDLNSLIEKYNGLASADTSQVFKRVQLGMEDIATLRARLVSNTVLLNGFIQRSGISTVTIEYTMLISRLSCESHEMHEMQARIADVLGLHRTTSRVSLHSVISLPGSVNTKRGYQEFCKSLYEIGITPDMISQKKREILNIWKPQNTATGSEMDDNTIEDQSQSLAVSDFLMFC